MLRQIPEDIFQRVQIFHLRGAINYDKLNLKHRTMMALLYAKAKGLPEEKRQDAGYDGNLRETGELCG